MKERIEELARKTAHITGGGVIIDTKFVSQAITVAVNEALEMAAMECENVANRGSSCDDAEVLNLLHVSEELACAEAIRKLKVN